MKFKTKKEAAEALIDRYDQIPFALIERAFGSDPTDLQLIAGGTATCIYCGAQEDKKPGEPCEYCEGNKQGDYTFEPTLAWPAGWGTLFHPRDMVDEKRIRKDAQGCAEAAGVLIYDSDETGLLLAIDGAGYDFYEAHWVPLYEWLGYHWHEEEAPATS